jgi:hypothetical protein
MRRNKIGLESVCSKHQVQRKLRYSRQAQECLRCVYIYTEREEVLDVDVFLYKGKKSVLSIKGRLSYLKKH